VSLWDDLLALSPEILALIHALAQALRRGDDPKEALARIAEEAARSRALDESLKKIKG
jgi:hypothetical protein